MSADAGRPDSRLKLSFCLVGVGGQGTLLAADVLSRVGLAAGCDVKKSEVHGMSQRGGSVVSHVRWGTEVHSPIIEAGTADYLVAFERLEALRHLRMLRPGGVLLRSDHRIVPVTVTCGQGVYPDEVTETAIFARAAVEPIGLPAVEIATRAGLVRANNVVVLGALSTLLPLSAQLWQEVLAQRVPERHREVNFAAFCAGREHIAAARVGRFECE